MKDMSYTAVTDFYPCAYCVLFLFWLFVLCCCSVLLFCVVVVVVGGGVVVVVVVVIVIVVVVVVVVSRGCPTWSWVGCVCVGLLKRSKTCTCLCHLDPIYLAGAHGIHNLYRAQRIYGYESDIEADDFDVPATPNLHGIGDLC